ncbi:hypothetical protein E5288_WYG014945 [Bos mutus]|uniref:Secreted protein n=1 Tax=Bos mutus TaxID=72004 RepID=A0A6B0RYL7_9CETA|nr:hypothetical protein [Bos mutus]
MFLIMVCSSCGFIPFGRLGLVLVGGSLVQRVNAAVTCVPNTSGTLEIRHLFCWGLMELLSGAWYRGENIDL